MPLFDGDGRMRTEAPLDPARQARALRKLRQLNDNTLWANHGEPRFMRHKSDAYARVIGAEGVPRADRLPDFNPAAQTDDLFLTGSVGRGGDNHGLDVFRTKVLLHNAEGFGFPRGEHHDAPNERFFRAIEGFQARHDLKRDGRLNPGGPTHHALGLRALGPEEGRPHAFDAGDFARAFNKDGNLTESGVRIFGKGGLSEVVGLPSSVSTPMFRDRDHDHHSAPVEPLAWKPFGPGGVGGGGFGGGGGLPGRVPGGPSGGSRGAGDGKGPEAGAKGGASKSGARSNAIELRPGVSVRGNPDSGFAKRLKNSLGRIRNSKVREATENLLRGGQISTKSTRTGTSEVTRTGGRAAALRAWRRAVEKSGGDPSRIKVERSRKRRMIFRRYQAEDGSWFIYRKTIGGPRTTVEVQVIRPPRGDISDRIKIRFLD